MRAQGEIVGGVPEPEAESRTLTPGAARALVGRGACDAHCLQPIETGSGIETELTSEPAVDHRRDPFHRDRGLGDVGRQDDAPPRARAQRRVLGLDRQVAEERAEAEAGFHAEGAERFFGTADLAQTGQEDQQVARRFGERAPDRRGDLDGERAIVRPVEETGLDWMESACAPHHGSGAEKSRQRARFEGCRHHEESEIWARLELHLPRQRESEVGGESALVKLVEDHGADAREEWVALEPAEQDALGREDNARVGPEEPLEADPPADLHSQMPPALGGDAAGRRARRHAPGLENEDAPRRRRGDRGGTRVVLPAPGGASRIAAP